MELGYHHHRWSVRVSPLVALTSQEIRKFQECPEMKILTITLKNCKKSLVTHFTEHLFLLNFKNLCKMFCRILFIQKILERLQEKRYLRRSLFINKVSSLQPDTSSKITPAQLFSSDFCENIRNTFLIELLRWLPLTVLFKEVFSLPHGTLKSKHYFNVVSSYSAHVFFVIVF